MKLCYKRLTSRLQILIAFIAKISSGSLSLRIKSSFLKAVIIAMSSLAIATAVQPAKAESCSSLRNKYNQMVAKTEQYTSMGNMTMAKRFLDQAQYYVSEMKRTGCK